MKATANVAASVRQRLLNLAKARGEDFQSLLTRFGIERLLYRLAVSSRADDFVLKGAALLVVWADTPFRATKDLDLLGRGDVSAPRLEALFRDLCALDVPDDGLQFLPESIRVEPIREDQDYGGLRIRLEARLAAARIALQVDVGIGDAVTPRPSLIEYPTLLDFPAPRIRAYARETVVAEKFHAMVEHGLQNSRMKDFFDLWILAREFQFEGPRLTAALAATFGRRGTTIPGEAPVALTDRFGSDPSKRAQWDAFLKRARVTQKTPVFENVLEAIARFVLPPAQAAHHATAFELKWPPGGPWGPA